MNLERSLRDGVIPEFYTQGPAEPIFVPADVSNTADIETTNVAGPNNTFKNCGRKTKKRFLSTLAGETRATRKQGHPQATGKRKCMNVVADPNTRVCTVCNQIGTCARSNMRCRNLSKFGSVQGKHSYEWLLNLDIPKCTVIGAQDVCGGTLQQR